jgi:hypothetical protein
MPLSPVSFYEFLKIMSYCRFFEKEEHVKPLSNV